MRTLRWSYMGWDWEKTCKKVHDHSRSGETQKTINFGGKLSFILSFLFLECLHCTATFIFSAPTCTTTIITLEPCALNAEFQNFILGFNKLPYFADITERGDRRRKEAQRQGDFTDNSNNHIFTLNIFFGYGCVTDTYPCNMNMHKTCNSCYM